MNAPLHMGNKFKIGTVTGKSKQDVWSSFTFENEKEKPKESLLEKLWMTEKWPWPTFPSLETHSEFSRQLFLPNASEASRYVTLLILLQHLATYLSHRCTQVSSFSSFREFDGNIWWVIAEARWLQEPAWYCCGLNAGTRDIEIVSDKSSLNLFKFQRNKKFR